MKTCTSCGAAMARWHLWCGKCGALIPAPEHQAGHLYAWQRLATTVFALPFLVLGAAMFAAAFIELRELWWMAIPFGIGYLILGIPFLVAAHSGRSSFVWVLVGFGAALALGCALYLVYVVELWSITGDAL